MIFPRETNDDGKDVVRLYTQINKKDGAEKDVKGGVKLSAGDVKVEDIMEADRKVHHRNIGVDFRFSILILSNSKRSNGGQHIQSASVSLRNIRLKNEFSLPAMPVIHILLNKAKVSTPP